MIVTVSLAIIASTFWRNDKPIPGTDSQFMESLSQPEVDQNESAVPVPVASDNSSNAEATDQETSVTDTPQSQISRNRPPFDPFAYLDEQRDEPWATQKEQELYDRVSRIPGGANRVDVDCRTTFCRVEVVSEHTCILIDSRDPEYTEEVERQLTEHAMAEMIIWRNLGYDGLVSQCDGKPGLYMTIQFDRVPTAIEASAEDR